MSLSKAAIRKDADSVVPMLAVLKPFDDSMAVENAGNRHKSSGGKLSLSRIQTELEQVKLEASNEGRELGYSEGFNYGMRMGRKTGHAEAHGESKLEHETSLALFLKDLDQLSVSVKQAMAEWMLLAEQELAALSIEIAEKVIAREVSLAPGDVLGIARECLQEVTHADTARVLVNGNAFAALQGRETELLAMAPSLRHVEIVCDPSLSAGVVVDTDGGRIDGLVQTRLRTLIDSLGGAR